jgi:IS5 family transposase
MVEQLIAIFCEIDDFCKEYEKKLITGEATIPKTTMILSEIMTIAVMYHLSHYKEFKWYYIEKVCGEWKKYFPRLLSYNRFVEIMQPITVPLILYLMKGSFGKCSGINFVDSTSLDVCDNHRIWSHKVFKDLAKRGKSSTGWFFGFKLHLVVNDKGEILSVCLTPANVDDKDWEVMSHLTKNIFGKLFGDKGYMSPKLFANLWDRNIQLVTKIRKNMKNKLMNFTDKLLLRKRAIIESVNDFLKNICNIEHSRHRSVANFFVNTFSALVAYSFLPKKPSISLPNFPFAI